MSPKPQRPSVRCEEFRAHYILVRGHRLVQVEGADVCTRCHRRFALGLLSFPPCTGEDLKA